MFTASCISEDKSNSQSFFWMLEDEIKEHFKINKIRWLVAKERLDYTPLDKSKHQDRYSYSDGIIIKYFFEYVPTSIVINPHPVVTDELIGANFTSSKTEIKYIKLTGHKMLGAWHWYTKPIHLIDLQTNREYWCQSVTPYKDKGIEFKSPKISKEQDYIIKLRFGNKNPNSRFKLIDGDGTIYSSFSFRKK